MVQSTREAKQELNQTQGPRSPTLAIRIAGFYPCTSRGTAMCTNILGITRKVPHNNTLPRGRSANPVYWKMALTHENKLPVLQKRFFTMHYSFSEPNLKV
ncbi:unnamed protein product [Sphacelaria rigidula]